MPPKGVHLLGPVKGVNTRNQSTKLADGQFVDLRNVDFTADIGGYVVRKGSRRAVSSALSASALGVRGGKRTYHGSTRRTLLAHGASIFNVTSAGVVSSLTLPISLTSDKDTFFESYGSYDFSVNGFDEPLRYQGTTVRKMGFPAPTGNLTASDGGAGVLTGDYVYNVTFIYDSNEAHESSPAASDTILDLVSRNVALTDLPLGGASSGVTGRKIYRTKGNG